MNFTSRPLRHDWNVLIAVKNFVVGSCVASGIVSLLAPLAPDAPLAPSALGAAAVPGRIACLPSLLTVQPSGSWRSTWPASITGGPDDSLALDPQPAANSDGGADDQYRADRPGSASSAHPCDCSPLRMSPHPVGVAEHYGSTPRAIQTRFLRKP